MKKPVARNALLIRLLIHTNKDALRSRHRASTTYSRERIYADK